jgi:membrane protein implicated in regulation of membrane protease activity
MTSIQSSSPEQQKDDLANVQETHQKINKSVIWMIIGLIIILLITVLGVLFLVKAPSGVVSKIRDIFIIFMAIQSLFTGFVLIILIIQIARLTNLLQNEIKPILDSTNETVSNLRGTTVFLSENLVEPIIKMNEMLAGLYQFLIVLGLAKKSGKSKKE